MSVVDSNSFSSTSYSTNLTEEMPGDQDIDDGVQAGSAACQQVLRNMELATVIFCCLKDIAYSEFDYEVDRDEIPFGLPAEWKKRFARFARVNRAFFHTSVDILWETLGSFEPLLALLEPDTKEDGEPVTYCTGISPKAWERFDTYSGRVKVLFLKADDSPRMNLCWFMFMSTARKRPDPLLPSVKNLTIESLDDLSIFLAFNLLAQLESLIIDIPTPDEASSPSHDFGLALSAGLAAHSHLTTLDLKEPCEAAIVRNVSQIRSLTSLRISIEDTDDGIAALMSIENMEMLETLAITQSITSEGDEDTASQFPPSLDISAPIARASKLTRLRKLEVTASSTTQFLIAANFSPRSLERLLIEVLCYETNKQMVLIPFFLAIHVTRNPNLESIWVDCQWPESSGAVPYTVPYIDPESTDQMRNDPRLNRTKVFLTGLGALDSLQSLHITKVPFLSIDINIEILKVLPKLQQLKDFTFHVISMSSLSTDKLVLPPLDVLEEVSRQNLRLEQFKMPLDVKQMPTIPGNYNSTHHMKFLTIPAEFFREHKESDKVAFTEEETFLLARYIDKLFPSLDVLRGEQSWFSDCKAWAQVAKQVLFSQQIREDSIVAPRA